MKNNIHTTIILFLLSITYLQIRNNSKIVKLQQQLLDIERNESNFVSKSNLSKDLKNLDRRITGINDMMSTIIFNPTFFNLLMSDGMDIEDVDRILSGEYNY